MVPADERSRCAVPSSLIRNAAIAADLVVLSVRDERLHVLLVRRGGPPFKGRWALPGGFVEPDEDLAEAAVRELEEETGVRVGLAHLEQVGAYGRPGRDPRGRVVSVAHLALVPPGTEPVAGSDASGTEWRPVAAAADRPRRLAFDHGRILSEGLRLARERLESTTAGTALCRPAFTMSELRAAYEAVWDAPLHARTFNRAVTGTPGFVVRIGRTTQRGGGRPASLYRRGPAPALVPRLVRPDG
jgi:8-oxo-dGTP diphosphatase